MLLKDFELLQINKNYISNLQDKDPQALVALSLQLASDLKEARDRLNQNSSNSSRPSSSDAPWITGHLDQSEDDEQTDPDKYTGTTQEQEDPAPLPADGESTESTPDQNTTPDDDTHKKPRSPGRQPGSPGFGRQQHLTPTAKEAHFCQHCSGCGSALAQDCQQAWTGFDSIDVIFGKPDSPGLQLTCTRHIYYQCCCPECGLNNRTEPYRHPPDPCDWNKVELTQWRLIGPSLAALISYLCMDMRLSRRKVVVLMYDLLGLHISVGCIQNCIVESARALSPLEEEIIQDVLNTDLLHADETTHKESGVLLWLWVFISSTTALFQVGYRSKEIWNNLLASVHGEGFQGWMMSDGYGVYREYARRLRCWAHLIRKAKGLSESCDRYARACGQELEHRLNALMQCIYQAREGPDKGTQSIAKEQDDNVQSIKRLCEVMKSASHEKTRALGVEFLNDWEAIFRILDYPAWPLTNNEAERALRHWVIMRRMTQGTRSEQGSRAVALFASVITTCRLRKASPLLFMRDVIQARRAGQEVLPLPPVVA